MLFDDDEQLEVRHVISLAHHAIDIYSGGDVTPEGELFIKRNALRLQRKPLEKDVAPDAQVSKPFYLFSENCSEKEDFYFALLRNQHQTFGSESAAPTPRTFEVKNIITLVQKLHSSEDQVHSRWLNALLGRLFLGIYRTKDMENVIREKITKKISRVKKPSFLTNIALRDMNMGEAAPIFTNLRLRDLTVEGECVVEADVRYTGQFRGEVAATAKLDLGPRFKSREVNLVLAVVLQRLEGHIIFRIKAPPSNRVWFSFQTMPKMEMAIEPIVSSRQITYTVILRQIENRIKEVFAETLVQPFWDDIPFFKTEHKQWRGGIFQGDDAVESSVNLESNIARDGDVETVENMEEMNSQTRPMEKSHSLPVLESQPPATGAVHKKTHRSSVSSTTSVPTLEKDAKGPEGPPSPQIIKSVPEPVVGTVDTHADTYRPSSSPPDQAASYMTALQFREQSASAVSTPPGSPGKPNAKETSSASSVSSKDDVDDALRGRLSMSSRRRNTAASTGSGSTLDGDSHSLNSVRESFKDHAGSLGRTFFSRREGSSTSLAFNSVPQNSDHSKRNTLAAVTNAAKQAQQWGWNALQKQREAKKQDGPQAPVDLSMPMGGGQPLPPPGTPLPRPPGGVTKIGPSQAPTRKPVSGSTSSDHSSETISETNNDAKKRPTQAPPLPQRRRRGESQDFDAQDGPNMLVIEVPSDSEPSTPAAENTPNYEASWVPEPPSSLDRQQEETPPVDSSSDLMPNVNEQGDENIVARPAVGNVNDEDDDDYAGWMSDNDMLYDEQRQDELAAQERPTTSGEQPVPSATAVTG